MVCLPADGFQVKSISPSQPKDDPQLIGVCLVAFFSTKRPRFPGRFQINLMFGFLKQALSRNVNLNDAHFFAPQNEFRRTRFGETSGKLKSSQDKKTNFTDLTFSFQDKVRQEVEKTRPS